MMKFGDHPIRAAQQDWLNQTIVSRAVGGILADTSLELPLTIGIYGDWGSGKTSLMHLLREQVPENSLVIWFNAWEYAQHEKALWRAFLLAFTEALRDEAAIKRLLSYKTDREQDMATAERELVAELDQIATSLYRSQTYERPDGYAINWRAAALSGARTVARMLAPGLGEAAVEATLEQLVGGEDVETLFNVIEKKQVQEYREHVDSIEQFRCMLHTLLERRIGAGKLFVFIDDLDRCLPESAISVLEAIKIFFEPSPGQRLNCVFVLGMDRAVVEEGIRVRYHQLDRPEGVQRSPVNAREYLDKIIQLPLNVPPLNRSQIERFIERWCEEQQQPAIAACGRLIATGVAPNPRSVKRTLNILRLMMAIYAQKHAELTGVASGAVPVDTTKLLAKLLVLQISYPELYQQVVTNPAYLLELENVQPQSRTHTTLPERLKAMFREQPFFPSDNSSLADLVFYTRLSQH